MTKAPPSTENKPVSDRREAELASCRSELEKSRHDYSQLQEATTRLGSCSNLTACLETLVDHVHALVDCQSSVVFLDREGRLTPETYRSPYRDALGNAHLTGLSDDLAEQAWASRALAVAQDRDLSPLFAQEACAAALPLGELGILYAGRARGYPFTSHELRLLALLASQAALAASWLLIREEQSRALKLYQESCQRLEHWSKGLSRLVEGAAEMNSSLDPDQILDALVDQVLAQVDESSLALFLDGEVVRAFPPGLSRSFAERTAPQLEQLQQVGKPLALDARWSSLQEGEESLLFVPFLSNGALLLGQRPRDAFPRQQSDLISMLATQASVALEKARTHRELQLALERLKESEMALIQGSKMAAVGELAAGVAHELNTPLGSILLGAEGALDCLERNPARACQSLEMVVSACLKTRDIVAKLLYYSREARAEQMLSDLNEVVRDTLGLYEHQLRLSGLAVVCELADLPEVPLCPNEIQQVLVNLLLNARDALAPTGGTAWVRTRHASPWVELEIEDSGPGIEASVALRIFEPFYTTKPVGKGTGLGLSVSRRILERHGGTLSLASSTGGARFVLSLPERCDSATIG